MAAARTTYSPGSASPLPAILVLTFLASIGTGILWSGISFIAKHEYAYTQERTFALYIVTGLTYVVAALGAGWASRRCSRWLTPRSQLAAILLIQGGVCFLPLLVASHVILWVVACASSVLAALLWPIVESYLTAGRHGRRMRSAMGWWNVVWTSSVAVAMLMMAPFIAEQHAVLALVAFGPVSLAAMLCLPWFTAVPGRHDESAWSVSITAEYPLLLRSVRILLPLSYLLIGAISPLMPYRLEEIGVEEVSETPITATWMIVRVVVIAVMWRLQFWHGRWGALLLGGGGMMLGFLLIAAAPALPLMLLGLGMLGGGQGIVYYAALYYAMSVGRAEVDAGGVHEGLIGVGYALGPLAAMGGLHLARAVGERMEPGRGIITVIMGLLAVSTIPAIMPYFEARARRRKPGAAETYARGGKHQPPASV